MGVNAGHRLLRKLRGSVINLMLKIIGKGVFPRPCQITLISMCLCLDAKICSCVSLIMLWVFSNRFPFWHTHRLVFLGCMRNRDIKICLFISLIMLYDCINIFGFLAYTNAQASIFREVKNGDMKVFIKI